MYNIKNKLNINYIICIIDMYNTSFKTKYHTINGDDGDTQYRKEILLAFNMKNFDLEVLNKRIHVLYTYLLQHMNKKDVIWFKSILTQLAAEYMSTDNEFGFMLLFSFDKFHLIHNFLTSYFTSNEKCNKEYLMNIMSK